MKTAIRAIFDGPPWMTFLFMGVFGGLFAICSFNLLELFRANWDYISQYGLMALMEGGGRQLAELIFFGYLSVGFYVLFKGCLYGLLSHVGKH